MKRGRDGDDKTIIIAKDQLDKCICNTNRWKLCKCNLT